MCGRFATGNVMDRPDWADWLGVDRESDWPAPSWNVAPTQTAAIIGEGPNGRSVRLARWGLIPHWWTKPLSEFHLSTFNARSEDAAQKPAFRTAWAKGRCLVPALGYYEWTGPKGAKQAWFVTLDGNAPGVTFAGLWSLVRIDGEPVLSFTILTCAAGPATRDIHPRTPVFVDPSDWSRWLTAGSEAADLMRPPPDERVNLRRVSPAVGNVRNNGPELIEPFED